MATPNYGYEKRQRELEKRRKKEDKLKAKADRKVSGPYDAQGNPGEPPADDQPADGGPAPTQP